MTRTPAAEPAPGRRRVAGLTTTQWAAVACGVHVVLGLLLYQPALFPGGDNAGYMILGESLRTGAGYRDLYLPDTPVHTKYPPLYPAVLAVLGWVGGLQLFKLASLAFTTAAVGLTATLGRRTGATPATLAAAFLLAANPVLLDYSHYVLSEAPFVFFVLLSLFLLRRGDRWWIAGLAAAAAAFLTRTAGLPLLLAAVLHPILRKRWRPAVAALLGAVTVAGGWAFFQRLGAPEASGYLAELVLENPYDPAAGTVGVAGLLRRSVLNLWEYLTTVLPATVTGWDPLGPGGGPLPAIGGIAVAGLAAAGWFRQSLREIRHVELFTFLYLGLIVLWPSVWTDSRFLLPVLPLLLYYAADGASLAGARIGRWRSDRSGEERSRSESRGEGRGVPAGRRPVRSGRLIGLALFTMMLLAPALLSAARTAPERLRCLAAYRAGSPCLPPALASFLDAGRWARENTPEDAIVVSRKPRFFYYVSDRQGDIYRYTSEPDLLIADLEAMSADYVVVDRISTTTARYLIPAIQLHAPRFQVEYREGTPPTWILRFVPEPLTTMVIP